MPAEIVRSCAKCGRDRYEWDFAPSRWDHVWPSQRACRDCQSTTAYERLYQRGKIRYPFRVVYRKNCEVCGDRFLSQKAYGRFCTRRCKDDQHKADLKAERLASKPERACLHCGAAIPPTMRADARYCSEEHNSAAHGLKRGNGRVGPGRRRDIERAAIIKRDGGRCHVCGRKCKPSEIHLDHLVPLAAGGDHSPENLAVACASCNLSRGARGAAQLRLMG